MRTGAPLSLSRDTCNSFDVRSIDRPGGNRVLAYTYMYDPQATEQLHNALYSALRAHPVGVPARGGARDAAEHRGGARWAPEATLLSSSMAEAWLGCEGAATIRAVQTAHRGNKKAKG